MARVCDEAWGEVQTAIIPSGNDSEEMLRQMITRVMAAVAAYEHEPIRLKSIALNGVEG